jgi:hypothetical protein
MAPLISLRRRGGTPPEPSARGPSPEQTAGEGGQRRIDAHLLQALQLGLGGQQPIEGIAMGLRVASGADAVMDLHGKRLETLLLQQGVNGASRASSSSGGRGASSTSVAGICSVHRSTPGWRRG